jgi:hypothetical protein
LLFTRPVQSDRPLPLQKVIEFLIVVEAAYEVILFWAFYFICRIRQNHFHFERVLQSLPNISMEMLNGAR